METETYKVGDKVIVSSKLMANDPCNHPGWDLDMLTFCNHPVTIARMILLKYDGSQAYRILEDHGKWLWVSRWMKRFQYAVEQKDISQLLASS